MTLPDQRDRFPGQLRRYRVGAYVEFDVWAGDESDACLIVTHVGIPDAQIKRQLDRPALTMAGKINGKRITADADLMRVLSVNAVPTPPWHVRDDVGLLWRLPAEGCGIEGRDYRLTHVDPREGRG